MPHHPCLAERKGDEYPDDVELDEPAGRGVETPDQQPRQYRQDDDAVAEHQSITAAAELAGQVSVPAQDRGEDREAVEGGVRRQHQDGGGECLHQKEKHGVVAEDRARHLGYSRTLLIPGRRADQPTWVVSETDVGDQSERGDTGEHGDGDRAHRRQSVGRVPGFGRLEVRAPHC